MKKLLVVLMAVAVLTGLMVVPVFAADKLVVTDAGGVNTKFVVRDDGTMTLNGANLSEWPFVKFYQVNSGDNSGIALDSFTSGPGGGGGAILRRSRGDETAKAIVQNGDRLGFFVFGGYDGVNLIHTAGFMQKLTEHLP